MLLADNFHKVTDKSLKVTERQRIRIIIDDNVRGFCSRLDEGES